MFSVSYRRHFTLLVFYIVRRNKMFAEAATSWPLRGRALTQQQHGDERPSNLIILSMRYDDLLTFLYFFIFILFK